MLLNFEGRPSDSPFVERIWLARSERAGMFHSIAMSHWEMVVTRYSSGWSFLFSSEEQRQFKWEELLASDALLLGRVPYEIFAATWPSRTGEFADRMNSLPKYVVSTSLEKVEWNNSQLIKDAQHVVEEIARLKQQQGQDVLLSGSADLFHTLSQHHLIDEYRFLVYPIILGAGKCLFKEQDRVVPDLVRSWSFSSGVVALTYHPQGKN